MQDRAPLVISDARSDPRVGDNGAIRDLQVVAYAGWPLLDAHQEVIGSLCAIHSEPHAWTHEELETLADLAAACSAELVQRELAAGLATAVAALTQAVGELEFSNEKLERSPDRSVTTCATRSRLSPRRSSCSTTCSGDAGADLDSPAARC